MEIFAELASWMKSFLPSILAAAGTLASLFLVNYLLERRSVTAARQRLPRQVLMLILTTVGLVLVVVSLPVSQETRTQLLQLLGLLLSAMIAFSSTSFVGNAMAGLMLRALNNFRPGDFLQVGEHFGRVSERGLFHTEIQTEDRDLTTLPNLYLVTNPVKVVRSSGTIVSSGVSIGYDVHRAMVEKLLLEAARDVGLEDPFVQVVELGDFSVTYRVAGLLAEVKQIITTRSQLRAAMLDALHGGGVEIVSPAFMNQRVLPERRAFIPSEKPTRPRPAAATQEVAAEDIVFDKADQAESRDKLRQSYKELGARLEELGKKLPEAGDQTEREKLEREVAATEARRALIAREIEAMKDKDAVE